MRMMRWSLLIQDLLQQHLRDSTPIPGSSFSEALMPGLSGSNVDQTSGFGSLALESSFGF